VPDDTDEARQIIPTSNLFRNKFITEAQCRHDNSPRDEYET